MRSSFSLGRVIAAGIRGKSVDGVEREYAVECGGSPGSVPVDVFERRSGVAGLETRAVTPGVSGGTTQAPIVPALFDRTILGFLGIAMPSVGIGDAAYPVLSGSLAAAPKAKGAAADEPAASFTTTSQEPRAITASFRVRYEDLARLEGMEEALRRNIQDAMTFQVDNQALNGSAADHNEDGEFRGLLAQLTDPSAPGKEADWAGYNTEFVNRVDGLFAVTEMGVKGLVGPDTYRHAASAFRATESNESFTAYWNRTGGGIRASRFMPAVSSKVQQAVLVRSNPAMDNAAVMPHWATFDMTIRDVYSSAAKREVVVNAILLCGDVVVLRPEVYSQAAFQVHGVRDSQHGRIGNPVRIPCGP